MHFPIVDSNRTSTLRDASCFLVLATQGYELDFVAAVRKYFRGGLDLMPERSKRYRQFARLVLVTTASAAAPSPHHVVETFWTLRERLKRTLAPIFGPVAVEALFERSVDLAAGEFDWLSVSMSGGPEMTPNLPMASSADTVLDAVTAVMAFDIGLLVEFVGEDLILPLVQKAWGPIGRLPTSGESD